MIKKCRTPIYKTHMSDISMSGNEVIYPSNLAEKNECRISLSLDFLDSSRKKRLLWRHSFSHFLRVQKFLIVAGHNWVRFGPRQKIGSGFRISQRIFTITILLYILLWIILISFNKRKSHFFVLIKLLNIQIHNQHAWNVSLHKKWSFPLRITSVNVTKFAGNRGFGHIYWRNP